MSSDHLLRSDKNAQKLVPTAIARDFCVLPRSVDSDCLTLYCVAEFKADLQWQADLEFVLERPIKLVAVERSVLEDSIVRHYPAAAMVVRNCPIKLSFECPKFWSSLTPTETPGQRACSSCNRIVHLCTDLAEARRLGENGECICYADPNAGLFLGELDLGF